MIDVFVDNRRMSRKAAEKWGGGVDIKWNGPMRDTEIVLYTYMFLYYVLQFTIKVKLSTFLQSWRFTNMTKVV